jgi:putative hydrolase of the HAD superfamily
VGGIYAAVCADHGLRVPVDECNRLFEVAWAGRIADVEPGRDRFSSMGGSEDAWWESLVLEVLSGCGVAPSEAPPVAAFRAAFASPAAWRIHDGVPSTIRWLRRAGFRLGILSNWDSRLPSLLGGLGLTPFFDAIVCSAMEGIEKPARRIFEITAERMGLPPDQVIHVGDRVREDYLGARAAGMSALWFDRHRVGEGPPPEVSRSDAISRIPEIQARFGDRPDARTGAP